MKTLTRILTISAVIISTLLVQNPNAAAQQQTVRKRISKDPKGVKPDWTEAEAKWKAFSEKHLDKMQKLSKSSELRQFTEIRSDLIYKYLPKFKFFTDEYLIFALNISGEITPLGMGLWSLKNPEISDFMMKQEIKVKDASIAIEVVKLMEDIMSAPNRIGVLKINTNNYKIFDKDMYRRLSGDDSQWKYNVTKENDIWTVKPEYIGSAQHMAPTISEIVVDNIGRIKEVRQQHRDIRLP